MPTVLFPFRMGLFALLVTAPAGFAVSREEQPTASTNAFLLLNEATALTTQMESPNDQSIVYVRLADVRCRYGDRAAATLDFEKALKVIAPLPPAENTSPDLRESHQASIAEIQARCGDIEGAQKTLTLLSENFQRSEALGEIALAQARAGQFTAATKTASDRKSTRLNSS